MWFRKRNLFDKSPSKMSFIELLEMQKALIAKLILVNEQIEKEERAAMELAKQKHGSAPRMEANLAAMAEFNATLRNALGGLLYTGKL